MIKWIIITTFTCTAAITIMGFMSYTKYLNMLTTVNSNKIYNNISVNGVDVGGLNKEEALEKLLSVFQTEQENKTITLKSIDTEYIYRFEEFEAKLDYVPAVEEAYAYARKGSFDERYNRIVALGAAPLEITYEPEYSYDVSSVQDKIDRIFKMVHADPKNATIDRKNGEFVITKEVPGKDLDVSATAEKVKELLDANEEGVVDAVLIDLEAEIKEADVSPAQSLIGTFSTSFSEGENGRNTNIRMAASKINDIAVKPGEEFSTNAAFGPSTTENGYAFAPVIKNGKLEDGVGGGMCQVSSTLYVALLYAEVEIVERYNHSLKVGYVDYGFDATLAGDYIDLRFRNELDLPVFLECTAVDGLLVVNVYGRETRSPGRTLSFRNELLETMEPPGEDITEDSALPRGERIVDKEATPGFKYVLFKEIYENGVLVDTMQINISKYKARPAEVRVGTGPVPVPVPEIPVASPDPNVVVPG